MSTLSDPSTYISGSAIVLAAAGTLYNHKQIGDVTSKVEDLQKKLGAMVIAVSDINRSANGVKELKDLVDEMNKALNDLSNVYKKERNEQQKVTDSLITRFVNQELTLNSIMQYINNKDSEARLTRANISPHELRNLEQNGRRNSGYESGRNYNGGGNYRGEYRGEYRGDYRSDYNSGMNGQRGLMTPEGFGGQRGYSSSNQQYATPPAHHNMNPSKHVAFKPQQQQQAEDDSFNELELMG